MTALAPAVPNSLRAVSRLLRLGPVVASASVCFVGALLARPVPIASLALGLVAVGAAVATANVFNDIYDIAADRINVPERPLPSGALSVRVAWLWFVGLLCTAVASGLLLGTFHAMWVGLTIGASILYSVLLKRVLVLGGLVVGALLGNALLFGASLGSDPSAAIHLGSIEVALFTFGRETLKGIRDIEGDRIVGVVTVASVCGRRSAIWVFLATAPVLTIVATLSGSWLHLLGMTLLVAVPQALIGVWCLRADGDQTVRSAIGRSAWLWATGLFGISLLGV